jgi:hypothetical protein
MGALWFQGLSQGMFQERTGARQPRPSLTCCETYRVRLHAAPRRLLTHAKAANPRPYPPGATLKPPFSLAEAFFTPFRSATTNSRTDSRSFGAHRGTVDGHGIRRRVKWNLQEHLLHCLRRAPCHACGQPRRTCQSHFKITVQGYLHVEF